MAANKKGMKNTPKLQLESGYKINKTRKSVFCNVDNSKLS